MFNYKVLKVLIPHSIPLAVASDLEEWGVSNIIDLPARISAKLEAFDGDESLAESLKREMEGYNYILLPPMTPALGRCDYFVNYFKGGFRLVPCGESRFASILAKEVVDGLKHVQPDNQE